MIRLSPYGMDTCATCDSPDVTHAYDGNDDPADRELIPMCRECCSQMRVEFPATFIVAYTPKGGSK